MIGENLDDDGEQSDEEQNDELPKDAEIPDLSEVDTEAHSERQIQLAIVDELESVLDQCVERDVEPLQFAEVCRQLGYETAMSVQRQHSRRMTLDEFGIDVEDDDQLQQIEEQQVVESEQQNSKQTGGIGSDRSNATASTSDDGEASSGSAV